MCDRSDHQYACMSVRIHKSALYVAQTFMVIADDVPAGLLQAHHHCSKP